MALKPAYEPIIVAMKPLDGTFAQNALKHGVGGWNIDGARIDTFKQGECEKLMKRANTPRQDFTGGRLHSGAEYTPKIIPSGMKSQGRWPANLILSHLPECREVGTKKGKNLSGNVTGKEPSNPILNVYEESKRKPFDKHADPDGTETVEAWECAEGCPVRMLDEQSGELKSGKMKQRIEGGQFNVWGRQYPRDVETIGDSGGASRFFYTAKASRSEREKDLKGRIPCVRCGGLDTETHSDDKGEKANCVRNDHPTVKPQAVMDYLCKLTATPTGGTVLDPFAGTGKTALACLKLGRNCILIDDEERYCEISKWLVKTKKKRRPFLGSKGLFY